METRKAFTLVELLVVISIIGILSATVFASLSSARQKAKTAKIKAQMTIIAKALTDYYNANGTAPINVYRNAAGNYFWCVMGTNYPAPGLGTCLSELVSGGYFPNYPVIPYGSGYYYFNYSNAMVLAVMLNPEEYGPEGGFWHCSDAQGGVTGSKYYCISVPK